MLSPVLYAMATPQAGRPWRGPRVLWRSSAPGVDVGAWLTPNPLHPLWGSGQDSWLAHLPNGFDENVASLSWVAVDGDRGRDAEIGLPRPDWLVDIHGHLRGALSRAVRQRRRHQHLHSDALGAAPLPAHHRRRADADADDHPRDARVVDAVRDGGRAPAAPRWRGHDWLVACIAVLLIFELLPSPRPVFSAAVPEFHRIIADDPRPVRVMNLPFGLKDGLSERGAYSARYQYFQTVHEKRLIGGYISRLPDDAIARYRRHPVVRVLLRLSEARTLEPGMEEEALAAAPEFVQRMQLGYVVVDSGMCSPELVAFVKKAFPMRLLTVEGPWELYATPFALPDVRP